MTINKAMVILKALNSRRCELSTLRSQVATKERRDRWGLVKMGLKEER